MQLLEPVFYRYIRRFHEADENYSQSTVSTTDFDSKMSQMYASDT